MNPINPKDLPAPCMVESGIIVNKVDMLRLLRGLHRVRYIYRQDSELTSKGEGCVMEAFSDPNQATLVANHSLYLNVNSFDYLQLLTRNDEANKETNFALVQDNRCLCLTPLDNVLEDQRTDRQLDAAAIESIIADALSASWDASLDDERNIL